MDDWRTDPHLCDLPEGVIAFPSVPGFDHGQADGAITSKTTVTPPPFSQDALALEFVERHADVFRYVDVWGRWFAWDECRWLADDKRRHFDTARTVCREAGARAESDAIRKELAKSTTVAAVVTLAKSDQRLAAGTEQWDQDPWALNTPIGVVDLHTGRLGDAKRGAYHTKVTAVGPGDDPDCPQWLAFLRDVFAGDAETILFVQRVAGYSLTGITTEHALFFCFGTGGNGKGVFLNTLCGVLGDYARTAPMEAFTACQSDRHPTELAMLRGARVVQAQETEQGRAWAESRIKALTGGDPITARFMRQDFFEYAPQFKLIIAGNHKPTLRGVDEAIRRRFHLIPFTVTIPAARRDPGLAEKLRAEWPGILRWAIDGCLAWQETGLRPPMAVTDATAEYLEDEDAIGRWLAECCTVGDPNDWEGATELFASWRSWAERNGEPTGSQKTLSSSIKTRGFKDKPRCPDGKSRFWGLSINRRELSEEWHSR